MLSWTCGLLFAFLFVYAAAYAVLVRPVPWAICHGNHPYDLPPYYLYGGDVAQAAFKPIHSLDRFLRPRSWGVFEGDIDSWMDARSLRAPMQRGETATQ